MSTAARARALASAALLSLVLLLSGCLYAVIPPEDATREDDGGPGTSRVYTVDSEGTLTPEPSADATRMWKVFQRVATPRYAARVISEFHVTDDPESDFSAMVTREYDRDSWILTADVYLAEEPDFLLATMIHEYGHLLSLQISEIAPEQGTCPTLELSEGCAADSAALYAFQEAFWKGYADAPSSDNVDLAEGEDFFDRHQDDFVDAYAATNVVEDFAETFTAFVYELGFEGTTVAARKLEFFWDRPDYVEVRDRIRTEFLL